MWKIHFCERPLVESLTVAIREDREGVEILGNRPNGKAVGARSIAHDRVDIP